MSTTSDYPASGAYEGVDGRYDYAGRGEGWIIFAAAMLGLGGVWAIIDGILAISSSKVFIANTDFVFSDLNTWGWIVLIMGVVTVCAAAAVASGSEMARWFGMIVAGVNA